MTWWMVVLAWLVLMIAVVSVVPKIWGRVFMTASAIAVFSWFFFRSYPENTVILCSGFALMAFVQETAPPSLIKPIQSVVVGCGLAAWLFLDPATRQNWLKMANTGTGGTTFAVAASVVTFVVFVGLVFAFNAAGRRAKSALSNRSPR